MMLCVMNHWQYLMLIKILSMSILLQSMREREKFWLRIRWQRTIEESYKVDLLKNKMKC